MKPAIRGAVAEQLIAVEIERVAHIVAFCSKVMNLFQSPFAPQK
jgi:hypothetical protein